MVLKVLMWIVAALRLVKILPTLLVRSPRGLVITSGVDKMRSGGLGGLGGGWTKIVASNFLHKRPSQVSKQRIQGLFIELWLSFWKGLFIIYLFLVPACPASPDVLLFAPFLPPSLAPTQTAVLYKQDNSRIKVLVVLSEVCDHNSFVPHTAVCSASG